jgi:tripartite-type tricarboxylate transporter receptor subunit TctC
VANNEMRNALIFRAAAIAAACVLSQASLAAAADQDYPTKPVTLVVPYAPGGPADTAARLVADIAGRSLGQRIVVDNRPGAATRLAATHVAHAPKDGYTLLECTSSTMITAALAANAGFRIDDFAPISLIASNPFVMSVAPNLPVLTAREFVDYAKPHPGQLNFGSLGEGSAEGIMGKWFAHLTDTELVAVPYKGGLVAALQDLMAGRIQLMFDAIGNSVPHYRGGQIKILGVATPQRVDALPDVPTLTEQGFPLISGTWLALCAPAGTPTVIQERLGREIAAAVASEDYRSKIASLGMIAPAAASPSEFRDFIASYVAQWRDITRTLGIELE